MPPSHVDVNVHPTKREVSFLNQESMVETIQKAIEGKLMESNTTRTFYAQTLLPGVTTNVPRTDEERRSAATPAQRPPSKVPVNKLVRTDALNPAGRLHAFLPTKSSVQSDDQNDLALSRRLIRQRRNPTESTDLTSVQELLADIDQDKHSELTEIVKKCVYVGMADATMAFVQFKTCLYLLNVVNVSDDLNSETVVGTCWTLFCEHFPALKSLLKPPRCMANDGTFIKVAHLENLYKVFERC